MVIVSYLFLKIDIIGGKIRSHILVAEHLADPYNRLDEWDSLNSVIIYFVKKYNEHSMFDPHLL